MGGKPCRHVSDEDPAVEDFAGALIGGRAVRGAENDEFANSSRLGFLAGALAILAIGGSFIVGTLGPAPVLISS